MCVIKTFGLFSLLLSLTMAQSEQTPEALQVIDANSQFTTNFYNQIAQQPGNVFFSPISIHAVLSMVYQGARASTAEKLAAALKLPTADVAANGYKPLLVRLNSIENVTLLMANKVFVMEGKTLNEQFEKQLVDSFQSGLQKVNFAEAAQAAKTINAWVEEQTRNKIKDLITPDGLNALTRLVLVNAIYFKGNWLHQFKKEATKDEDFFITKDEKVSVKMMHTKQKFNYKNSDELNAQIVELPYLNEDISMFIILPHQVDGIKDLEAKLATSSIKTVTDNMYKVEVKLALPRFKIEQTIDLKDILTNLGLGEIFDESKANFQGILADNEQVFVSKAIQKSFIEVNEEGAEAAAATGMVMMMRSSLGMPRPLPEFRADHSFVFYLTTKNNDNLFFGRISKPN